MAKKKKSATAVMNSNLISRYASRPVTVRVGTALQPYYVPEILLQSLYDLPRSPELDRTIDLRDVDVETAHVIVHFLHTGQYQTLSSDNKDASGSSKLNLKKAIAVFIASKKYGLDALKELARLETQRVVEETSAVQAAHAVGRRTLATLLEDAGWLQNLVLQRVERAFEEDDELFSSASFFAGVESLTLAKVLGQHVAKLYRGQVSQLQQQFGTTNSAPEVSVNGASGDVTDQISHKTGQDLSENAAETTVQANCNGGVTKNSLLSSQMTGTEVNRAFPGATVSITAPEIEAPAVDVEPNSEAAEEAWVSVQPPTITEKQEAIADPATTVPAISHLPPQDKCKALDAHYKAKTGPFEGMKDKKARELLRSLKAKIAAEAGKVIEAQPSFGPAEEVPFGPVKQERGAVKRTSSFPDVGDQELDHVAQNPTNGRESLSQEIPKLGVGMTEQSELHMGTGLQEQPKVAPSYQPTVVEEVAAPPPEIEAPVDEWSFLGAPSKKKKKKARKVAEEAWTDQTPPVPLSLEQVSTVETAPEAWPLENQLTTVPEMGQGSDDPVENVADAGDPWVWPDSSLPKKEKKKKKTKKAVSSEEPLVEHEVACPPAESTDPVLEPARPSIHVTQDVTAATTRQFNCIASEVPVPPVSPPVILEIPLVEEQTQILNWDTGFGPSKKKKKKKVNTFENEPPLAPPLPRLQTEAVIDDDLIEPELEPEAAPPIKISTPSGSSIDRAGSSDTCPLRAQHLTQVDGWRHCRKCELYMRHIAVELYPEGLPSVDGSVVV